MKQDISPFEKLTLMIRNSIMLKLMTIGFLVLLLLIPTSMVESVITEREKLNQEAISEVNSKWATDQLVRGPILSVPVSYEYMKDGETVFAESHIHLLPKNLDIKAEAVPKKLSRGIYDIVVYESQIDARGSFDMSQIYRKGKVYDFRWAEAFVTIGISDLRGIKDQVSFTLDQETFIAKPGSRIPGLIKKGITLDIKEVDPSMEPLPFQFSLHLQGSESLSFAPLGSTTLVNMLSSWSDPSFNGNFIPDERSISESGFKASWKILELNRSFPQSWLGSRYADEIRESAFGVNMLLPLGDYQKSMRSAKYAAMTIALTFLIFFLVEILYQRKIHPFQYTLVGLALCMFYILLVSISEHTSFNSAYLISALATIAMITTYSLSIFKRRATSWLLLGILSGIYSFLFTTLQLADFALLMGAVGLTAILALTMYFTRNIDWYAIQPTTSEK